MHTVLHTLDLENVVVKILHKVLYLRPGVRINVIEHIVQNWTKTFARMTHTSEVDKEISKLTHTSEPKKEGDRNKKGNTYCTSYCRIGEYSKQGNAYPIGT